MRVLMLGWEFPPHISGGLGTACYGLTRGLKKHGVDVVFVVPRAHGDEDQSFVQLVGCNEVTVPVYGDVETPPRRRSQPGERTASQELPEPEETAAEAPTPESCPEHGLEILEIDSLLSPYLTEKEYEQRFATWTREHGLTRDAARLRAGKLVARHWTTLRELVVAATGTEEIAGALDRVVRGQRTFELSGRYGPDLLTEVGRFAIAVAQVARTHEFDVIHAHDWMTYPAGIVAAAISGKPLVVHMHASEFDRSGEHVNQRVYDIERLGMQAADLVICVSHYTASVMRKRYGIDPNKLRVVHNAVTHGEQQDVIHWRKAIEEPIVLFLGRVTFQKGPDYFLEAAARVIQKYPQVKFVMAGSGDMLSSMIERSARLGLARNMHFTGFLRGKDVERMYAMADIYVMPSVSEPFGISPLEAMALDVPVIVSWQSGVSEVLRNALKVDFWDVEDIANKILALLQYPALREQLLGEGRSEVRSFRWEVPAQHVRDTYLEVIR